MKQWLLNQEMVKSFVAGNKTQARTPIKLPEGYTEVIYDTVLKEWLAVREEAPRFLKIKPPSQVGDVLWVGEAYQILRTWYGKQAVEGVYLNSDPTQADEPFNANGEAILLSDSDWGKLLNRKWPHRKTPSRFMYKSLARNFARVTAVRAELCCDITPEDCIEEGIERIKGDHDLRTDSGYRDYSGSVEYCGATASFHSLIESIYPGIWKRWVWVRTVEKIDKPTNN